MNHRLHLAQFLDKAPRGTGAAIARRLKVHPVMVSQWAAGTKPVPEDRAPGLEWETGFQVRCETSCPDSHWVRVDDPDWPHGKPLLDKASAAQTAAAPESPEPVKAV